MSTYIDPCPEAVSPRPEHKKTAAAPVRRATDGATFKRDAINCRSNMEMPLAFGVMWTAAQSALSKVRASTFELKVSWNGGEASHGETNGIMHGMGFHRREKVQGVGLRATGLGLGLCHALYVITPLC